MRYLADSHIVLWWSDASPKLSQRTVDFLTAAGAEVWVSTASLWELSIKAALGRLQIDVVALRGKMARFGLKELPITGDHAVAVLNLPNHHRDPFDRLLLAQAKVEDLTLVTADRSLAEYGIPVLLA